MGNVRRIDKFIAVLCIVVFACLMGECSYRGICSELPDAQEVGAYWDTLPRAANWR